MFSTGLARYFLIIAVAPEIEPVTISPVAKALFAEINKRELFAISSVSTVAVALEVEPVITSPLRKEPLKESCSSTTLSPTSKPCVVVRSSSKKLLAAVSVSKSILSIDVIDSKFNSADSMNRKYDSINSTNLG